MSVKPMAREFAFSRLVAACHTTFENWTAALVSAFAVGMPCMRLTIVRDLHFDCGLKAAAATRRSLVTSASDDPQISSPYVIAGATPATKIFTALVPTALATARNFLRLSSPAAYRMFLLAPRRRHLLALPAVASVPRFAAASAKAPFMRSVSAMCLPTVRCDAMTAALPAANLHPRPSMRASLMMAWAAMASRATRCRGPSTEMATSSM